MYLNIFKSMAPGPRWDSRIYLKPKDLEHAEKYYYFYAKLTNLNLLTQKLDPILYQYIQFLFDEEHQYIFDNIGTFLMKELLGIEEEIEKSSFQPEHKKKSLQIVAEIKVKAEVMSEEEAKKPPIIKVK